MNTDFESLIRFAQTAPCFHTVDMPYRLASPASQDSRYVRVWKNPTGEIIGFAVLQFQFWVLDYAVSQPDVEDEIVIWSVDTLRQIAVENHHPPIFFADTSAEINRTAVLTRHGFEMSDWGMIKLAHQLQTSLADIELPNGFIIRPLRGLDEAGEYAELHRTAFGTKNMSEEWRRRIIQSPHYRPNLDLVAVAPDGRLAAFCIGWLEDTTAQIEPLGVHPDFQKMGLGRAILLENLRRMKNHGADNVFIETETDNDAAKHLYTSVGFEIQHTTNRLRITLL